VPGEVELVELARHSCFSFSRQSSPGPLSIDLSSTPRYNYSLLLFNDMQ